LVKGVALFRATHPEPVLAVTAAVALLCVAAGRGASTGWAVAAVFTGQLFTGWVYDAGDVERDRAAGRLSKPIVAGTVTRREALIAAGAALLLCVPLSFANGFWAGAVHLVAVAVAAGYNLGLKSTPLSVACYAVGFGLVPAFVTLGLAPPRLPPLWASAAAVLVGSGAHFTQVLPDIETDRRAGLRGLPDLLGARASIAATVVLLGAGSMLILLAPAATALQRQAQLVVGVLEAFALAGVVAAGLGGRERLAFRLTLVAAGFAALGFLVEGRALA
jgi:4-hydroxybenzoate polyprenyltransferase